MSAVLAAGVAAWLMTIEYPLWSGTTSYMATGCHSLGFGPGHGCFPNYGTRGHSFRKSLLNGLDILGHLNLRTSRGIGSSYNPASPPLAAATHIGPDGFPRNDQEDVLIGLICNAGDSDGK